MDRKNFRVVVLSLSAALMLSLVSCDPSVKAEKQEKEDIQAYLSQNSNLTFVKQKSGLYYYEVTAGTGISPELGDSAFVKYTGMFLDGSVFDSSISTGKPLGFIVGEMIEGFNEGVQLMKTGGKATMLIPSKLAYGQYGRYPYIAGYTPLLFDVELIRVIPLTGK
jgi:FKBP-type peptidyl-prolyl cis-trans isomerase FkpA